MSPALSRLQEVLLEQGGLIGGLVGAPGGAVTTPAGSDSGPAQASPARAGSPAGPAGRGPAGRGPAGRGPAGRGPAQRAAEGPRAVGHREEYELLVEAIYEGYLLHYGAPRIVRPPEADLALLAGDQLYALGLARLVQLGDLDAVIELADVITLCALAHGGGAPELADAVWDAGARAIGWGVSAEHERAKTLARAGSSEALSAMRLAAGL